MPIFGHGIPREACAPQSPILNNPQASRFPMSHKLDHGPFLVPPGQPIKLSEYDPRYCAGLKNKKAGQAALLEDICVIKFFLNVSKDEQRERFIERLENPEKNWKFSAADLRERKRWDEYQEAFEDTLNATSTDAAPWYVIPADRKWFARAAIADIIASRIDELGLTPPEVGAEQMADIKKAREELGI